LKYKSLTAVHIDIKSASKPTMIIKILIHLL